jgi:hypothetical protein
MDSLMFYSKEDLKKIKNLAEVEISVNRSDPKTKMRIVHTTKPGRFSSSEDFEVSSLCEDPHSQYCLGDLCKL